MKVPNKINLAALMTITPPCRKRVNISKMFMEVIQLLITGAF